MKNTDDGLERLCKIYLNLIDEEKENIISLGEGLLKSQRIIYDKMETMNIKENVETNTEGEK